MAQNRAGLIVPHQSHPGANRRLPPLRDEKHATAADALTAMEQSRTITRKKAPRTSRWNVASCPGTNGTACPRFTRLPRSGHVADDESVPVAKRASNWLPWRYDIRRACSAEAAQFPVNCELTPFFNASSPFELFDELLKGVEMDLDIKRYAITGNWNNTAIAWPRCRSVEYRDFWLPGSQVP